MKKELANSRLHLRLQSSMSSSAPNLKDDGSSSSEPSPVDDSLGGDFEKLSLGQHTGCQNCSKDEEGQAPPPWFLKHMQKMEESLHMTIRREIQWCLKDVLNEHLSGQPSSEQSKNTSDQVLTEQAVPEFKSSVRPRRGYESNESLHLGITCDNCEQPVSGIRFKCGNCVDFDLCEMCEGIPGVHQSDHVFLKIRRPTSLATYRQRGERRKALLRHLYPQLGQVLTQGTTNETFTSSRCRKREKKVKRWLSHAENIFSGPWNQDRRNYRAGLQGPSRTPTAHLITPSQSHSFHSKHNAGNKFLESPARHLTEVSPSGALVVQPGQEFDKEWTVRNDSLETLATSSRLRFSWGSLVPNGQVEVVVPPLRPGETGIVGPVHFRAPQQEGVYHSQFLLIGHSGSWRFPWPSLSCSVHVTWQKEKHQEETKDDDAVNTNDPFFVKTCHCKRAYDAPVEAQEATESLKGPSLPAESEVKIPRPMTNKITTTDPEETDDTASILSISSCDSDDDYVKVQGPTQFTVSSASMFTKVQPVAQSTGTHLESQATSSSSIDLLSDMPQVEEETGQRSQGSVREVQSPVVSETPSPGSASRITRNLHESHFASPTKMVSQETGAPEDAEVHANHRQAAEQPERAQNQFACGCNEDSGIRDLTNPTDLSLTSPTRRRGMISEEINSPEMMIPVLPEGLVTGALTAAASVYNTAKALISNLQPPIDHHGPTDPRPQPQQGPPGPMSQLIEMGFHDRDLNQRLLNEKNGCLEDVVAELIRLRPDYSLNID